MARPRAFEEERALDAALRAFWTAGYEATSTQDLCEATGLGRSSIYNTFTSKRDLFQRVLRRYMDDKNATLAELLDSEADTRTKIRALLWQTVDAPEGEPAGCLVVNTLVELAPQDPETAETLRKDKQHRLDLLTTTLEAGKRAGEIDADKDTRALALFLISTISGMRVAARGGADRAELVAIANTALDAL